MRMKILSLFCIVLLILMAGCSKIDASDPEPIVEDVYDLSSGNAELGDGDRQEESIGWYTVKVAYANWSEDDQIIKSCLNSETMAISSSRHLPIYKIETRSELDKFIEVFKDIFTFNQSYNEVPSFSEVTASYDDDFFTKHSTVMAYVSASSGSYRYGVESVTMIDSTLCLNIYQINDPEVYTADMAGWFIIAELNPAVVGQCASFDAKMVQAGKDYKPDSFPGFLEYGSFSWKQVEKALSEIDEKSIEHIKTEGFVNTDPIALADPVERAKAEVTIEYPLIQYFCDSEEDMWMVRFFSSEEEGPLEEVYMDGQGITKLIIYANVARYDGTGLGY